MSMPPSKLSPALLPFADALDAVPARPIWEVGWTPHRYDQAPKHPLIPNAPPHDGVYRGSWVSPGICVRLDLMHASVSERLRAWLRSRYPEQLGGDDGFYEYGIESRSQRTNLEQALARLEAKIEESEHPPST
ncbi:hypothetical protein [Polyangium jinanense]|uniref:Uncharacterized protein n=1 Tax=Polyangium jinanense TaxID=2829994 RepID=A0A9X3X7Y4_9BACT|nr:hypothetical protein [Polyangium jinanense]MDC3956618.1 hypothetical protein [Polyangium jinanense]MDC3985599.1 hypothetical protein [Polyangium jinanense]